MFYAYVLIHCNIIFFFIQYSQKVKEVTEKDRKLDREALEKYKFIKDSRGDAHGAPLISPGVKFMDYHLAYARQLEGLSDILVCILKGTKELSYL